MEQTIKDIPLWMIQVSPLNPRKTIDQTSIEELADNIKRQGLLQPITVRPIDYRDELTDGNVVSIPIKYEIVCGERRYRAVSLNGSEAIPCIVRDIDDDTAYELMITENLQRKDIDPMEEAFAFAELVKRGKSVEEIANRFGKSTKFIRERIKLDELIPELKEFVSKGLMNIGAAFHIAKLEESGQRSFFDEYGPCDDDDIDDMEPITKSDAENFTDDFFKRIAAAEWDDDFEGSCKCICDKCPFNDANEGCLFNEMSIARENGCCTNRERWTAKRLDWWKQYVDKYANSLCKIDEELVPGKMIIAHGDTYYATAEDYMALKEYCTAQGYKMVNVDKVFERWQHLDRDQESTNKKLMNGEAYVVLFITSDYRGANVTMKCFPLKKQEDKGTAEAIQVAQLVRQYKTNIDNNNGIVAGKMRQAVSEFDLKKISWKPLTNVEWEILLALLINNSPYNVKYDIVGCTTKNENEFAKENNTPEGRDNIIRKWLRCKLSDGQVIYNPVLQENQSRLIEVWGIDDVAVKAKEMANLRKKQAKIEKQLTALGYDTEGKKLDF